MLWGEQGGLPVTVKLYCSLIEYRRKKKVAGAASGYELPPPEEANKL